MPRTWTVRRIIFGALLLVTLAVIGRFALGLGSGCDAALCALLGAVNGALFGLVKRSVARALGLLSVPFLVAYSLCWIPAWQSGTDAAQYSAWAPIGVGVLFALAVVPSAMAGALVHSFEMRRTGPGSTSSTTPSCQEER